MRTYEEIKKSIIDEGFTIKSDIFFHGLNTITFTGQDGIIGKIQIGEWYYIEKREKREGKEICRMDYRGCRIPDPQLRALMRKILDGIYPGATTKTDRESETEYELPWWQK